MMRFLLVAVALAVVCAGCAACGGSPWTARMCTSNASGNCEAVDNGQPHPYTVSSKGVGPVGGLTDVSVKEPACGSNGMGEVDVKVVDHDDLQVTIYCLVDRPTGKMTLPAVAPTLDGGR